MNALVCRQDDRRERVRSHKTLCGLDYVEVSNDQLTLTAYFLGKLPEGLEAENILIEGGRRVTGIRVMEKPKAVTHPDIPELDDALEVTLDKFGDFSTYTLRVVIKDEKGQLQPHPAFDPRYDRVEFSFKANCPSDMDCRQPTTCLPVKRDEPEINYLAKDYSSFRQLMFDRLALLMPDWQERHVPDLNVALVELLAYVGDHLSYYQDAVATEAYLDTARQRISVRRHARLIDYPMHEGCNARTWVCVQTDSEIILKRGDYFITKLEQAQTSVLSHEDVERFPTGSYEVFEPMGLVDSITLYPDQHEIQFYTWSDAACCLPVGATSATLVGRLVTQQKPRPVGKPQVQDGDPVIIPGDDALVYPQTTKPPPQQTIQDKVLHLHVGDVLIFEEIKGAKTGAEADANPSHRHAVRLTQVDSIQDPLEPDQGLTEITWRLEDALPFQLCLSSHQSAQPCATIPDVSIARGNLILVDHGKTVQESLQDQQCEPESVCDCYGEEIQQVRAKPYQPTLQQAPLVFSQPFPANKPASQMLQQDECSALPNIHLQSLVDEAHSEIWEVQADLLASGARDRHFVVETDNEGRGQLRFGNGKQGKRPSVTEGYVAAYRIGGGVAGNVGAGVIHHLVLRNRVLSGSSVAVSNPLPASGGKAPQSLKEVKMFAPHAFRQRLERAITADDYAAIVMREFPYEVQRAVARLRRTTGGWFEVLVAVDPLGRDEAEQSLLDRIEQRLYRYRRIGHELVVKSAQRVPLHIRLEVQVLPGYLRAHVKAALLAVLGNRALADGKRGFFHPDNLSFGDAIHRSKLVAVVQAVEGVESVDVARLERLHQGSSQALDEGLLSLGTFEIARLDNDPSLPENGRLELGMRGGR
ncbi:MAG TPA: putative baseplate assembly protein [Candidatus Thiothrix moscowensis]|uniref:putative baseplate assembly protein n=1 Tax=Thiothrix sp. UBA2016 TaxID=1947695 RepID=UPI0025D0C3B3|nr:putative baseplate assembly protein [Thiothrix sp. UBA2016]HRJ53125.1 putative baseplate assembly protein [Candidatus Thiothrix moscowensis]HRJ93116.1 putative baseplate assembly protein [Candidatus Thiothrix moscowensis]